MSSGGSWKKYNKGFSEGNIVEMIMNLSQGTISFKLDNEDLGIAFKDIVKKDDIKYKMAVYIGCKNHCVNLLSFNMMWFVCIYIILYFVLSQCSIDVIQTKIYFFFSKNSNILVVQLEMTNNCINS